MKNFRSLQILKLFFISFLIISGSSKVQAQQQKSLAIQYDDPTLEWGGCPEFMPDGCNITVLRGDMESRNSDILFKVPANSDIPLHWHNSAERMILISGEMEVTYEGEKTQHLKTGSYAYGPAKKPHTAKCKDSGPCILFIAFELPIDAIEGKGN